MNTPSHCTINLALLSRATTPHHNGAIALGAVLPDLPIFIFYFVAKYLQKMPERQIWSEGYYQPLWQNLVALGHSIPLAAIAAALCYYFNWTTAALLFASMVFHSLFDLPVHNDDAHRHFYPFSNYRFISPISYWDPKHYGRIVSLVELLLVIAVTPLILTLFTSILLKALIMVWPLLFLVSYFRLYLIEGFKEKNPSSKGN